MCSCDNRGRTMFCPRCLPEEKTMPKAKATRTEEKWLVKQAQPFRPFPLDMLRYDSMCPAGETDAHIIESTIAERGETLKSVGWNGTVLLRRFPLVGGGEPNYKRWLSMGWMIVKQVQDYDGEPERYATKSG